MRGRSAEVGAAHPSRVHRRWLAVLVPTASAAALMDGVTASAAEPSPVMVDRIDPRTSELPVIAGGPVEALVGVVLLGLATSVLTIGWQLSAQRLARRRARRP
ncbi:MAG: hypothetical protein KF809_09010 [Chloroflexi bacterium]|nr:hypothetical protein [Chloroflexota bacterium]